MGRERQLRTQVLLSYVSAVALCVYQYVMWNYDIPFISDHGVLLRTQALSRNEFSTVALTQFLPFTINAIAILYGSPLAFSVYAVYAIGLFGYDLYSWWWEAVGFDVYYQEYGPIHKNRILPEIHKGYPVVPGFSLLLLFNVFFTTWSLLTIVWKTVFPPPKNAADAADKPKKTEKKDDSKNAAAAALDDKDADDSTEVTNLDSVASEPSKALFVKKRKNKKK